LNSRLDSATRNFQKHAFSIFPVTAFRVSAAEYDNAQTVVRADSTLFGENDEQQAD
jgi:hypothetical protein